MEYIISYYIKNNIKQLSHFSSIHILRDSGNGAKGETMEYKSCILLQDNKGYVQRCIKLNI